MAKPIVSIVDKTIVIIPNIRYHTSEKEEIKLLNEWIKKFEEFIANHKDMANCYYSIELILKEEEVCDICGKTWKTLQNGDFDCCAGCGEVVE